MKQFIVDRHTTPNTPTLEQVPTEKEKVYADLASAEADIANIAENEFVDTLDEEVVKEGDIATKDYVDNKIGQLYIPISYRTTTRSITSGNIHSIVLDIISSLPVGLSVVNVVNQDTTYQTVSFIVTKASNSYFSYICTSYYSGALESGRYNNGSWS